MLHSHLPGPPLPSSCPSCLPTGSPLHVDTETLVRTGKKLKKNNVALDVVSFGEEEEDKAAKLEALLAAVNSNDNSHLVHVPPGSFALSDVLIRCVIPARVRSASGPAPHSVASTMEL